MSYFFTSDTHFGHNKDFIWEARGFNSIEEMNDTIVERWNSVVSQEDTVYHLGDVFLGDKENFQYFNKLNGNIIIIAGNHDTDSRIQLYREAGYEVKFADRFRYKKYNFFLSHFPTETSNYDSNGLRHRINNLFGHTHQKDKFYNGIPYMYNVGMDSHDCYPVHIDTIIENMKKQYQEVFNNEN